MEGESTLSGSTAREGTTDRTQWPHDLLRSFGRGDEFILTRWVFLRSLGLVYLAAFSSLTPQIVGLVGHRGILPVGEFMAGLRRTLGGADFTQVPTLLWLSQSDSFLRALCVSGVVLALLVVMDVLTLPALLGLWALYLSLFYAGQDFLGFQWDILLLETGFLAIFFAAWPRLSRQRPCPPVAVLWLLRLLLFRLIFDSGLAKLASGDPTWRDLTATAYHYQTQPLPSPLAWFAYHQPLWFHKTEVGFTLFAELFVPFLIFAPRRLRMTAGLLLILLQLLIILTGNFAFFNWLTIVLCFTLFDDAALRRFLPGRVVEGRLRAPCLRPSPARRVTDGVLAVLLVTLNLTHLARMVRVGVALPAPLLTLEEKLNPFFVVNNYGLFATMTTQRPEIILEGSRDGVHWLPYEFRNKPGDLGHRPLWVAPHQPRLDWQMWFAALQGSPQQTPWMGSFVLRLLQGEPQVLALLGRNPFPGTPPRFIRARLYEYMYTDVAERRASGQWWKRQLKGEYFQPVSLEDFRSVAGSSGSD